MLFVPMSWGQVMSYYLFLISLGVYHGASYIIDKDEMLLQFNKTEFVPEDRWKDQLQKEWK